LSVATTQNPIKNTFKIDLKSMTKVSKKAKRVAIYALELLDKEFSKLQNYSHQPAKGQKMFAWTTPPNRKHAEILVQLGMKNEVGYRVATMPKKQKKRALKQHTTHHNHQFNECLEFLKADPKGTAKELENIYKESNLWANEYAPLTPAGQNARSLAIRKILHLLEYFSENPFAQIPTNQHPKPSPKNDWELHSHPLKFGNGGI